LLIEGDHKTIQDYLNAQDVPKTQIELLTNLLDDKWKEWTNAHNAFSVTPVVENPISEVEQ
jgi:hypothetical protein